MAKKDQNDVINARPTKRLVVHVITRDIKLEDAILDLVDNAIDGARSHGEGSLAKFKVQITANKDYFQIIDNCGGISRDTARNYAFRFGRPEDYAPDPDELPEKSIGNFGVGMKRALLKMGNDITVQSWTEDEYFKVIINVKKWLQDDDSDNAWTFRFEEQREGKNPPGKIGTIIRVGALYKGVAERFSLATFETDCALLIREKESTAMEAGMSITLNDSPIEAIQLRLLQSTSIKPILKVTKHGPVQVRLYAGVGERDNDEAGWTIVCNGRTILRNDKTPITGWGYSDGNDRIATFHNQYARFRGYLFFESPDQDKLPWNTTKTSVDEEHPLYRHYYLEMVAAMKDVFGFLKDIDDEKDATNRPLTEAVERAKPISLDSVKRSAAFVRPTAKAASVSGQLTWIRYQRKTKDVNFVMKKLPATSPRDAGEKLFDTFLNSEKG
jgi:hypothetical protein